MLKPLYNTAIRAPYTTIVLMLALSVFFLTQLSNLRWETDAQAFLPHGHEAIAYDEKVDDVFGVKDAVIIGIVNQEEGIFNTKTLSRIERLTSQVAGLPGVIANRPIDVASLATASVFTGDEQSIGDKPLMPSVPETPQAVVALKDRVFAHRDLFVGNLVSADGEAAMIRAKLKEGVDNRYRTYWQIKSILNAELYGDSEEGPQGGQQWGADGQGPSGQQGQGGEQWGQGDWQGGWQQGAGQASLTNATTDNGDQFYLAGRPVIEVSSGLNALADMKIMIPLLVGAMIAALGAIFRTVRGIALPLFIMAAAITWTLGIRALFDVPLYTISTMLPVILVAVGIGDAVHVLSHYYDRVLDNPHRASRDIVREVMDGLGPPLITTTLTTGVGFSALFFADMPPFQMFGLFTVLGIFLSWLLTMTFLPAALTVMPPRVAGYLAKRRSLRVHNEQSRLTRTLVALGQTINHRRGMTAVCVLTLSVIAGYGSSLLFVDSSWMRDFKPDSQIRIADKMLNEKFDGTIFLNVVIDGGHEDALKDPALLGKIAGLQEHLQAHPAVGDSRSLVDYVKSMNQALHSGQDSYKVLPDTKEQIGEYLFLFSVSGRPEQLDQVADYRYQQALATFHINTDHTRVLKEVLNQARDYVDKTFDEGVSVNFAGSAHNSYVWADLLIDSQMLAIALSKVGIFLIASLLFRSLLIGLITVIPVGLTTLLIAGGAGLLRIPLDVSTALAAGVAIGVGVDYAVHYLFRYRRELQSHRDHERATAATLRSVGKTIVFNATVVTVGFLVLSLSQFPPHAKLGYFVATYMVVSCLAALITLPLAFACCRPRGAKEVESSDAAIA